MATSYAGGKNRTDFFAANSLDTGVVKVTALTMVATNTAVTAATDAFLKANQNYSATITPTRPKRFECGGRLRGRRIGNNGILQ